MNRWSGLLMLLLMGLAVFAVVDLLFGDSMTEGAAGSGYAGSASGGAMDLLGASGASLETKGTRPKTAEEIAAEKAKAEEAAVRKVTKEEGVFGSVTDARGNALAGAVVKLLPDPPEYRRRQGVPDGDAIATAMTNEQGEYIVGPSAADPHAKVRAEAPGFAASLQRVRARGVRIDFILDKGGALDLRVIDVLGKPVEGATALHVAGTVVSSSVTDADGKAHFASLPTGTGNLVVTKPGFGAVRDQNVAVAPGETEERTLVMPKGMEIAGSVVDGETQRPLAGVAISLRYPQLPTLEAEAATSGTKTDEEGRFKITGFVSGQEQLVVHATKTGFADGRMWRNAQSKGELQFKLLKSGEAFEGRVVDADSQPVSGATITYAWMQNEKKADVPSAETQEDGSFTLPLPSWAAAGSSWTVIATSDEHGLGTVQASVPRKDQGRAKELEIKLGGVGSVSGTVKDKGGQPVQGAVVSLTPDWKLARETARRGEFNWQVLNVINNGVHHNLSAVTGMDGTYKVSGVPALAYQVTAAYGLDQYTLPEAVAVRADDDTTADIALGEGGTIEGWVLDSDGEPVVGAYVYASPVNNRSYGWWRRQPNGRSQSDGKFVLRGVTDDTYNLWAYGAGYGSAQHKNARQGDTEIQVRLKALGWIEGVVNKEGRPYAGMFTILVRPVNNNRNRAMPVMSGWSPGQQQRTFNTSDGKFKVKGLQAGDFTVQASTNDGLIALQEDVVTVMDGRASREAQLELTEGARVSGTVRDDETGRGVPNAYVYANGKTPTGQPAPSAYTQSDAKGKYELRGLGGGSYTINAYVGGAPVSEAVDLTQGERRSLDLVKQPPGSVHFTVVDEKGAPIADARPNIQSSSGSYVGVNTTAMRKEGLLGERYDWRALWNTNAEGVLIRYHVPPGLVTVWAHKSGYTMEGARPQVEVATGQMTEVVIKLKRRGAAPPPPVAPGRR